MQPCQSLFVAPCSHTWHYKCIRSLLNTPSYPVFVCPNCRMTADLEADIEEVEDEWEQSHDEDPEKTPEKPGNAENQLPPVVQAALQATQMSASTSASGLHSDGDAMDVLADSASQASSELPVRSTPLPHSVSQPLDIRPPGPLQVTNGASRDRTPSPPGQPGLSGTEGPITPRNDAGPWVFDGSAAGNQDESGSDSAGGMRSLDAATEMEVDR